MANGANRLFDVIKNTSENTNLDTTQLVSLTVKSLNPLIFNKDDKLDIAESFCVFDSLVDPNNLVIGNIVLAICLNSGQVYYILKNLNAVDIGPKLNSINRYTEDEQVIGEWFGKKLYQKTIKYQPPTNYAEGTIHTKGITLKNYGVYQVDEIWLDESGSFFKHTDGNTTSLNYYKQSSSKELFIATSCLRGSVTFIFNFGTSTETMITVTIRYTKTID